MISLSEFNPSIIQYFFLLVLLFFIIFIRYLFAAGLYHVFVFKIFKKNQSSRILQTQEFSRKQMILEITRSAISSVIFAAIAILMLALYLKDMTLVYEEWKDYPTWYHPIGIILILFLQDTYYYWLHRWMHRPKIFRIIHKWHHDSIQTNSLTSFSFHPFETLLQSILFPILLMCVPIHIYSLMLILIFMTITAIINHGAVEIYPKMKGFRWIQKWIIGASHHDVHHKKFLFNYGLYFTFWDRVMDTEDS
jgi:sterol desaturase/sphingolipid hydroxylase (fatty acid hydroxylase superfamily)